MASNNSSYIKLNIEPSESSLVANIMVCGKAGVGKTVLINHLIGADVGKTGVGKPITTDITAYTVPGSSLVCYDTPGFEIKQGQVKDAIDSFCKAIRQKQLTMDGNQMIDAVLYCVCYQGPQRFEDDEANFVAHIKNDLKIPVYIVFVQYSGSPNDWETDIYHCTIKKQLLEVGCDLSSNHFCPVLCYDMSVCGGQFTIPAYGLDKVINLVLDEALQNLASKIANAKFSSLESACDAAKEWVIFYSFTAAAEVAAIALPGADVAALAANESFMAAHIYKIIFNKSKIKTKDEDLLIKAVAELAVPLVGALAGPVLFNEAIKLVGLLFAIETAGLSEAAAITTGAVVGFGVTFALGNTTVDIFRRLATGDITLEQIQNKSPKFMTETKQIVKRHYEEGKRYAKEHPDQIRKTKHT